MITATATDPANNTSQFSNALLVSNAANQPPSFTKGVDQTVNEDPGPQTVTGWATNISAGPPDESGQLLTFLVTTNNVARNHARTQRRHQRAMARVSPERDLPDFTPESDAHLDGAARREAVTEAFARLSPKDQDVVSLCILEDMSLGQAASALGVPTGTVKSRLSRAKARLLQLTTDLADAGSLPGGVK